MLTASFLEEIKTYAQDAVRVVSAATRDDADRALADALCAHIARFRPRPDVTVHAAPAPRELVSHASKLP